MSEKLQHTETSVVGLEPVGMVAMRGAFEPVVVAVGDVQVVTLGGGGGTSESETGEAKAFCGARAEQPFRGLAPLE